jgi:hypothetical protein
MVKLYAVGFQHPWYVGEWSDVRFLSRSRVRCERVLKHMGLVYRYQFCRGHEPDLTIPAEETLLHQGDEDGQQTLRFWGPCGTAVIFLVTRPIALGVSVEHRIFLDTWYHGGVQAGHVDTTWTEEWPEFAHWSSTADKEQWTGHTRYHFDHLEPLLQVWFTRMLVTNPGVRMLVTQYQGTTQTTWATEITPPLYFC